MKWFEELLIVLLAILSNVSVTITSPWESSILVALTEVAVRLVWTILVLNVLKYIYGLVRTIFIR